MNFCVSIFLIVCFALVPAGAHSAEYEEIKIIKLRQEFNTRQDWQVSAYQTADKNLEFSEVPSRLCFSADHQSPVCHAITSKLANEELGYAYQQVKELSVISKPHLVKFVAEFSAGGSGWLDQISFWQYEKATDSFQKAGLITLTEQGEYKLFDSGKMAGLLVTADAHLGEKETHFSRHRFYITIYRYKKGDGFEQTYGYLTEKKYPSFDNVEKIDVISHEIARIKKRLLAANPP